MMDVKSRKFLQNLRLSAEEYGDNVPNRYWQHAYNELAMAADKCDAMIARCTDSEVSDSTKQSTTTTTKMCGHCGKEIWPFLVCACD